MSAFVGKVEHSWVRQALRKRLTTLLTASQVRFSSLPPEPVIPSKKPFKAELQAGKRYSWCTCGHSKKQPFCDGAHKFKAQGLSPLRFVPDKDATVWLCGCKHTHNPPYCDGTHKQAFIVSAPLHQPSDSWKEKLGALKVEDWRFCHWWKVEALSWVIDKGVNLCSLNLKFIWHFVQFVKPHKRPCE